MKWQSEEHVGLHEAAEWARHFEQLETDMDRFLGELFSGQAKNNIHQWIMSCRYVTGPELVKAGLAELIDFKMLDMLPPHRHPATPVHRAGPQTELIASQREAQPARGPAQITTSQSRNAAWQLAHAFVSVPGRRDSPPRNRLSSPRRAIQRPIAASDFVSW